MVNKVRLRFAPSPTGPLHIGGARSALFNYLLATKMGGDFILRIEDTDLERSSREAEENIKDSLRWLGIEWNEGIDCGGSYGPYRQTERLEIYHNYVDKLLKAGLAYRCYCSEEEIAAQRDQLLAKGELPRYLGNCRNLSCAEEEAYKMQGRKPVIRFKVPENETIIIHDLVRGEVMFESNGIGDFVIVKSDGIPTYNFAVVIDDVTMKISHVIRGEEHLSNTPRQVLIYRALQLEEPRFAHISLILGKDRTKMSKRHGATSVVNYKEAGYLPEALVNFLALLGWSPEGEEEIFSLDELIQQFSLDRVAKNPAVFDLDKLNWINGHYIRMSTLDRVTTLAVPYLQKAGFLEQEIATSRYVWLKGVVEAVKNKLTSMQDIVDHAAVFFPGEIELENEEAGNILQEEQVPQVIRMLIAKLCDLRELTPEDVKAQLKAITKELKLPGKQVFMPIRVALTGKMHGPELHDLIPLLGIDEVKRRLGKTMQMNVD